MLDLTPIGTRIIVKQIKIEKKGVLFIPENSREAKELMATEGQVLAVGSECMVIKVGNQVFYGKYAGAVIHRNDSEFILMDESDVLALVKTQN